MGRDLSFEAIYADHGPYVRRVLQRLGIQPRDLDDVVQDTFVAVHRQLPGFEWRAALETWLHAICWRVAASYHRRARTRRALAEATELPADTTAGLFGDVASRDQLLAALGSLAPDDSDLFALYEVGGLSILELSELTGLARATIRRRLDATRTRLERRLAQCDGQEAGAAVEAAATRRAQDWEARSGSLVEHATADHCLSRLQDLVIARWRGNSRAAGLETLAGMMVRAADETPGGIAFLSVVEPTSGPPDGPARAVMRTLATRVNNRVRVAAFTTRSEGLFRILPPVINTTVFLSGARFKMRFFNQDQAAFEYLAHHCSVTPEKLRQHCDYMRKRIDAEELQTAKSTLAKKRSWPAI